MMVVDEDDDSLIPGTFKSRTRKEIEQRIFHLFLTLKQPLYSLLLSPLHCF